MRHSRPSTKTTFHIHKKSYHLDWATWTGIKKQFLYPVIPESIPLEIFFILHITRLRLSLHYTLLKCPQNTIISLSWWDYFWVNLSPYVVIFNGKLQWCFHVSIFLCQGNKHAFFDNRQRKDDLTCNNNNKFHSNALIVRMGHSHYVYTVQFSNCTHVYDHFHIVRIATLNKSELPFSAAQCASVFLFVSNTWRILFWSRPRSAYIRIAKSIHSAWRR